MQILTFVLTIMMMLAIVTYARFETFLDYKGVEIEYQHFMQHDERLAFNKKQRNYYFEAQGPSDELTPDNGEWEEQDEAEEDNKKERLSGLLNIKVLVVQENSKRNEKEYLQTHEIALRLLNLLYHSHPAFKELYQTYEDLDSQILHELGDPSQHKIFYQGALTKDKLANIELSTPKIHEGYYMMLKGTQPRKERGVQVIDERSSRGYPSLLDYITISDKAKPLSIYLAPSQLLMAIYEDTGIVQNIMQKRTEIFLALRNKTMTPDQGKQELSRLFSNKLPNYMDESMLDYGVSKTAPPKI